MSNKSLWYWKKDGKIKGPFAAGLIQQYIILRRVHPNDLMSKDKKLWRKASTINQLIPEVVKNKHIENYDERLKAAKRWADDRGNSRDNLADEKFNQRKHVTRIGIHTLGWKSMVIVILVLIAVIYAIFYFTPERLISAVDCLAKPVAGINLQACALARKNFSNLDIQNANFKNALMQDINLSHSILSHSQMQYSQLANSNLTGTKLDHSDLTAASLSNAILKGTDFSYANLSYANLHRAKVSNIKLIGANLSKAIWFNGQVCATGSIGRCLINKKTE
ncbi:MAG: pentapeptide repeat-containing protein [Pseudomonadota bacterium]